MKYSDKQFSEKESREATGSVPKWVTSTIRVLPFRDHWTWNSDRPSIIVVHPLPQDIRDIVRLLEFSKKTGIEVLIGGSDYNDLAFSISYYFTEQLITLLKRKSIRDRIITGSFSIQELDAQGKVKDGGVGEKTLWRYTLVKLIDRVNIPSIQPTVLPIVEAVFAACFSEKEILEKCHKFIVEKQGNVKNIEWVERIKRADIFCNYALFRINIGKRHKGNWVIEHIPLNFSTSGFLKAERRYREIHRYTLEAVCHAFDLCFYYPCEYPGAGVVVDYHRDLKKS